MYDLGLKDKVILITGGSDGLGYASAELLSSEEAHVVICGRRGDYLNEKAKIITEKTGNEVIPIKADESIAGPVFFFEGSNIILYFLILFFTKIFLIIFMYLDFELIIG